MIDTPIVIVHYGNGLFCPKYALLSAEAHHGQVILLGDTQHAEQRSRQWVSPSRSRRFVDLARRLSKMAYDHVVKGIRWWRRGS